MEVNNNKTTIDPENLGETIKYATKMNSLYQICSKIMRGTKVIIFVGSSPSQGDIFFLKSDIKWAFLYTLIH